MKNDILNKYESWVNDVVETDLSKEERDQVITEINESFFREAEVNLPSYLLSKLTDWYLSDVLKDKSVDKVTNTEYAILSSRQLKRRDIRECSVTAEVSDYLELKYNKNFSSLAKTIKKESLL